MIPNIFVAIILAVLGYYIAKFVGNLLFSVLKGAGIDRIYRAVGLSESEEPSFDLSKVITMWLNSSLSYSLLSRR